MISPAQLSLERAERRGRTLGLDELVGLGGGESGEELASLREVRDGVSLGRSFRHEQQRFSERAAAVQRTFWWLSGLPFCSQ